VKNVNRLLLLWSVSLAFPPGASAPVYFVQGYHGGYYLTPEAPYREALDKLFDLLEHNPQFQVVLELEPYTLERMQGGEKFDCERFGRGQPTLTGWTLGGQGDYAVSVAADAARSGQQGLRIIFRGGAYAHALAAASAEKFRGRDLLFAGWIRQRQGRGAHLYIDAWDEVQYLAGSALRTPAVPDDGNWHRVEMTWRVPDNAFRLLPQAKCDGEPTDADFDDLSLKDAETGEEVLSHGGFEEVAEPTLRDEARLEKLRRFVQRGQMEIVGGAYTQPILYAIGDESALRQFVYGTRAVEGALGIPVKIYAAQEPGMCAQLPQILRQAGFEHVLYRTIWGIFGAPPHRNAENVWWIGNDGSKIQAVPSYAVFPLPRYGLTTHPSRQLIEGLERAGIPRPLFVALHDFVTETVPEPDSPLLRNEFGDGWANLCRRIPASPLRGREVVFSGAIRARQGGAHLYIDSHDAGGIALSGVQSKNVAPDGQWHDVQIRYLVPDHAVELFPQGRMISASGEADFDALRLTTADGAVVVDASFETGTLEGFGVGTSEGTLAQHQVVEGDAAAGQRFVTLQMNAPQIQAQVATLGEYFQRIGKPQETWYDAFKGFEFRFPFGLLSGEVQRADRESENLLLQTERLLAIAGVDAQGLLDDAWEAHLMGEHHDGWVCAPVVFGIWKQPTYAQMCFAAFDEAKRLGQQLMQDAGCWLPDADGKVRVRGSDFAVVNTASFARSEMVSVHLTLPQGAAKQPGISVVSPSRRSIAPSKTVVLSRHDDGSAREVEAVLLAQVPAMGYQRYKVVEGPPSPLPQVKVLPGEPPQVDNGMVRLIAAKEGVQIGRVGGKPFPIFLTGTFPGEGERTVSIAATDVQSEGGTGVVLGEGRIGGTPFKATFRVEPNVPVVRMRLEFDFGEKTEVGAQEDLHEKGLPSHARDDQKLRLVIPLPSAHPQFFSHAAFEVRRVDEERYPILRYAIAEEAGGGMAVFTDRATMGIFRREPPALEVVLAYGGKFLYAPNGSAPLAGKQPFEVGLQPYAGPWQKARVPQWSEVFSQPLLVVRSLRNLGKAQSLVALEPEDAALVTALTLQGQHLLLRLWRPQEGEAAVRVRINGPMKWNRTDLLHRRHTPQAEVVHIRPHQWVTLCATHS